VSGNQTTSSGEIVFGTPVDSITETIAGSLIVDFVGYVRGFRANHWNSGRSEGGTLYWSQSYLDLLAGVAWRS